MKGIVQRCGAVATAGGLAMALALGIPSVAGAQTLHHPDHHHSGSESSEYHHSESGISDDSKSESSNRYHHHSLHGALSSIDLSQYGFSPGCTREIEVGTGLAAIDFLAPEAGVLLTVGRAGSAIVFINECVVNSNPIIPKVYAPTLTSPRTTPTNAGSPCTTPGSRFQNGVIDTSGQCIYPGAR